MQHQVISNFTVNLLSALLNYYLGNIASQMKAGKLALIIRKTNSIKKVAIIHRGEVQ